MNPQEQVYSNIVARGYHESYDEEQYLARQVCKAIEELGELAQGIHQMLGLIPVWPTWVCKSVDTSDWARSTFDDYTRWELITVDLDIVKAELADLLVTVLSAAQAVHVLDGPYDVIAEAIEKSQGDVERGVRE